MIINSWLVWHDAIVRGNPDRHSTALRAFHPDKRSPPTVGVIWDWPRDCTQFVHKCPPRVPSPGTCSWIVHDDGTSLSDICAQSEVRRATDDDIASGATNMSKLAAKVMALRMSYPRQGTWCRQYGQQLVDRCVDRSRSCLVYDFGIAVFKCVAKNFKSMGRNCTSVFIDSINE